ncbi:MAG: glutamate--tRNA ligase family protein [Planctomycetota bacterium]
MTKCTSRLAPSPTGALHLGNARTFLMNWALAKQRGWALPLRVEDLDGPRIKVDSARAGIDILAWLGMTYDGEPLYQSIDLEPYRDAMRTLAAGGHTYASALTRSEVRAAASAPHADDHEVVFPPSLRPDDAPHRTFVDGDEHLRFIVESDPVTIDDMVHGTSIHDLASTVGDFVVWTKRHTPAYQLAVVVDDARQGVTDVVRGDDLLGSAARQTLLYRALNLTPPRWWHVPLVLGDDGHRLAKRHGDTRVSLYRDLGIPADRIIGLCAWWSGVMEERAPMSIEEFGERFDIQRMSRSPVRFTAEDDQWLRDI